ncbi:hypothetical protein SAMN05660443_2808 [Marinospirillum celere]|uniref:Uncharacterized protein n=1 Tax=Marinospirillum celere TaxID=1122252 RepID=A0A1I1JRX0_9GAMM|nr:hypothetical protein [Marinospirillum celere]SFC48100.1 hypothetical protein SAMN05660443_2808 [Marinospirillum celere]
MQPIIFSVVLATGLALSSPATASEPPPTALDMAAILMQSQGQLDDDLIMELLTGGITANMRIPPEHLGVAFWDKRTGGRLDRQEIREEIGPVRQEGAFQLLEIAVSLGGERLALDQEQLELLFEAAFIASMRRPPEHIDIEYYDRRQGPSGQGGGVSGRVPETKAKVQQPQITRPEGLPSSEQELFNKLASLDLTLEQKDDHFLLPLLIWARDAEELETLFQEEITGLHELGLAFNQFTDSPVLETQGDWQILYALAHFRKLPALTARDQEDVESFQQRLLKQLR